MQAIKNRQIIQKSNNAKQESGAVWGRSVFVLDAVFYVSVCTCGLFIVLSSLGCFVLFCFLTTKPFK